MNYSDYFTHLLEQAKTAERIAYGVSYCWHTDVDEEFEYFRVGQKIVLWFKTNPVRVSVYKESTPITFTNKKCHWTHLTSMLIRHNLDGPSVSGNTHVFYLDGKFMGGINPDGTAPKEWVDQNIKVKKQDLINKVNKIT